MAKKRFDVEYALENGRGTERRPLEIYALATNGEVYRTARAQAPRGKVVKRILFNGNAVYDRGSWRYSSQTFKNAFPGAR